jgi:hypothetical protein
MFFSLLQIIYGHRFTKKVIKKLEKYQKEIVNIDT